MEKQYKLLNKDGKFYFSTSKGEYGGYNGKEKIYGALDCPSALRWIRKGYYTNHRVFFANEYDAVMAGFRPCACCQKEKYILWKKDPDGYKNKIIEKYTNEIDL